MAESQDSCDIDRIYNLSSSSSSETGSMESLGGATGIELMGVKPYQFEPYLSDCDLDEDDSISDAVGNAESAEVDGGQATQTRMDSTSWYVLSINYFVTTCKNKNVFFLR